MPHFAQTGDRPAVVQSPVLDLSCAKANLRRRQMRTPNVGSLNTARSETAALGGLSFSVAILAWLGG